MPNMYSYVHDLNYWIDPFGLALGNTSFLSEVLHPSTVNSANPNGVYIIKATGSHAGDKKALYAAAGLKESYNPDWISHHVSYNPDTNEMTMQLVDRDAHKIKHKGGVDDFVKHHKIDKYGSEDAKKIANACG